MMADRIPPIFKDRDPTSAPSVKLDEVQSLLVNTVNGYNYDTFSFVSELLDQDEPLEDAYVSLQINSLDLLDKYRGSNCLGLAQKLAMDLKSLHDIDSVLIPSFGEVTPEPPDSAYAGAKTSALLIKTQEGVEYILDPAFAIKEAVPLQASAGKNSSSTYATVDQDDLSLLKLYFASSSGTREIHFKKTSLENPDESVQKNWLRSRTKYKIARSLPEGGKDIIDYDFSSDMFSVRLGSAGLRAIALSPDDMKHFMRDHERVIENAFETDYAIRGIIHFIARRQEIEEKLLIPSVKEQTKWAA